MSSGEGEIKNGEGNQDAVHMPAKVEGGDEISDYGRLKKEGNDLFLAGDYDKAIEKYGEAKHYAQNLEEAAALLHNIGFCYERMEDFPKGLEAYDEALGLKNDYGKVQKRKCKLLCLVGRYTEALDGMVDVVAAELKSYQEQRARAPGGVPVMPEVPPGFAASELLVEILSHQTELETAKVLEARKNKAAPPYIVEGFLRTFCGDPVSRMWKGLDPSPVDVLIEEGKAESLTGYMAALRDLKMKKYDKIVEYCTQEIMNPEANPEDVINAHFLRGTISFVWSMSSETVDDFITVTDSPVASNQLKSAAYLKLALRHTNTRHPFAKAEKIHRVSEDYSKSEELWLENPDVYFHGSMLLFERAVPKQAMDMLQMGISLCPNDNLLLKTFYWTLKLTLAGDATERNESYHELIKLEPHFNIPECHEMFAQALMTYEDEQKKAEYETQLDKAIAYNPADHIFKVKKLILRHWTSGENYELPPKEVDEEALKQMREFIETEGPSTLAYYHIGQLELMRGNVEEGLEAIEKSIELSGSIHDIEARVGAKLETQFHYRINARLKEEGLDELAEQIENITLKSFP